MRLFNLLDLFANRKLHYRTTFQNLPISIENRKGSIRRGKDWKVKMTHPYGYIRLSQGVDGDHVDCFIGPNKNAKIAYVIHTQNPATNDYDEDKVMLGFDSPEAAKQAFLENYSSPKFYSSMDSVPMKDLRKKLVESRRNPRKLQHG
jgi:hypothetical protein